jgi:biotin transporter BioY
MTSNDRQGRFTTIAIAMAAGVVLLPILYVLSSGPALWLSTHGYFDGYYYFVKPLCWLADKSEIFDELLHWYLNLWAYGLAGRNDSSR